MFQEITLNSLKASLFNVKQAIYNNFPNQLQPILDTTDLTILFEFKLAEA